MLRTLFLFTVVVSAVVADDETTQKSTTCDSFSAAECDAQSGCKAEGDKCVDDVGDGNEGGGGKPNRVQANCFLQICTI